MQVKCLNYFRLRLLVSPNFVLPFDFGAKFLFTPGEIALIALDMCGGVNYVHTSAPKFGPEGAQFISKKKV